MYGKRAIWWIASRIYLILAKIFGFGTKNIIFVRYKFGYFLKKIGVDTNNEWLLKRGFLQTVLFFSFFLFIVGHTTLAPKGNLADAAQHTQANEFFGSNDEVQLEEISSGSAPDTAVPNWRQGIIEAGSAPAMADGQDTLAQQEDFTEIVAGGTAIGKPTIITGSAAGAARSSVDNYTVMPGDTVAGIAYNFGVSTPTILWENGLTQKSLLKPGQVLRIPPVSGVMHTLKKGDTLTKIASLYGVNAADIISFNQLSADGKDLVAGERIMVPNGVKPASPTQSKPATTGSKTRITASPLARDVSALPASTVAPSDAGFIWPSGSHMVTQYFNPNHHAMDIAGPWQTPTYAAKSGVVEKAQCGWNGGYGCYVIIDHGNGIKTLYGHHSVLLVKPGDEVQQGQVIALMGNTGNVRGLTGIHLHFEVIVNGVRVNPLGYIR